MNDQLSLPLVKFKQNSLIVVEGKAEADRFFIIREGKVLISKWTEQVTEERGNSRGPGEFFAVVSAMSAHNHIETAQTLTDVTLIPVYRERYGEFIQRYPSVAMKIILDLSRQLRRLDEALSQLTLKKTVEKDTSYLFKVGDYYARQGRFQQAYYAFNRYLHYCPEGEFAPQARLLVEKIAPKTREVLVDTDLREFSRTYPKDSMFFAEGEPGEELFIIQRGAVKISKILDNREVLIAVLRGGDIFGEMALLEQKPRAASAVAHEDCMVTVVNRTNLEQMIREYPQIIARLTTLQAERIWFIYKQLANALLDDPLGRMYDLLRIYLERNRVDPKSAQSHLFSFGPSELVSMAGLSPAEGRQPLEQLLENKQISVVKNQIFILDSSEIERQASFYYHRQKIDAFRKTASPRVH